MAAKELKMVDDIDGSEKESDRGVMIVLSDSCMLNGTVLTIPISEALAIASNITIQAAMLV